MKGLTPWRPMKELESLQQVKAIFKNGVLEVTMPTPKQLAAKKIQVEAQK